MEKTRGHKLSEIIRTEKDKYYIISLIGGVKKREREKEKNELIETYYRLVVPKDWGLGVQRADVVHLVNHHL